MLVVRIDNSVPNTNKFNQLDSTANYSINFEDIKMIFLSFEWADISLFKYI